MKVIILEIILLITCKPYTLIVVLIIKNDSFKASIIQLEIK